MSQPAPSLEKAVQDLRAVLDELPASLFLHLEEAAARTAGALARGGGVFFAGNGGSAALAEHLAAELVGFFQRRRRPFRATALTLNGATLTALANDFPLEELFVRPVRALMSPGDVLVVQSTSGRSGNILRALDAAIELDCVRIGFAGPFTGELEPRCNWVLAVPSASVARIQEAHLLLGHLFCQRLESTLCPDAPSHGEVSS